MTSLGSALALAPPWWTALLLIPSNGVCKRAGTREHFVDVCVLVPLCLSLSSRFVSPSPLLLGVTHTHTHTHQARGAQHTP
jgi:hypothetical protein